jgi:hypothetical protein
MSQMHTVASLISEQVHDEGAQHVTVPTRDVLGRPI